MSAPRTNVEKQAKNHRAPLTGIAVVLGFVAIIIVAIMYITAERGNTPRDATHSDVPVSEQGGTTAGDGTGALPSTGSGTAEMKPSADPANNPPEGTTDNTPSVAPTGDATGTRTETAPAN